MGLPVDGDVSDGYLTQGGYENSKDKMAFLQTGDWGNVGEGYADLTPKRFGAAPTEHLVELFKPESTERRLWGQSLKKPEGAPLIWDNGFGTENCLETRSTQ